MKMRGYSVLFVCALCVFVLCVAAAVVVAQDGTPEKVTAEEAKAIAVRAREKGDEALKHHISFERYAYFSAGLLSSEIKAMGVRKRKVDTLSLPGQVPSKEELMEDIGRLETAMTEAKNTVEAVRAAYVDSSSNQSKKDELDNKMADVESKMTEVEQSVAAVTDENISTIDAVIEKAGELKTAAEEAMNMWTAAQGMLTTQLGELDAAVAAINATKNNIEEATKKIANNTSTNTSPDTLNLNEQLKDISTHTIASTLGTLFFLKDVLECGNNAAGEAKNEYTALAAAAEELKGKAEEMKQKVQIQHHL